ncbi:hypothetical protein LY76DRAFT_610047 [Colletotrichum caudatum]|nr:hypothetical protein LY76DRAFT_610047 [Colletotrichum caudatum]
MAKQYQTWELTIQRSDQPGIPYTIRFLTLHAVTVVEAAKFSWTLHKSCSKFKKIEDLEGPVGSNADSLGLYYNSKAWADLERRNDHFNDFVIVCRPETPMVESPSGSPFEVPYDKVRKKYLFSPRMLQDPSHRKIPVNHQLLPALDQVPAIQELWRVVRGPRMISQNGPSAYQVIQGERVARDLYAIIGAVIELKNRDGQKYSVSAAGEVSPNSS